jgi:hypothetical protein
MRCILVALPLQRWRRRSKRRRALQVGESETGPSRQHQGVRPRIAVGPLDERLLRRRAAWCVRPRIAGEPRDERLLSRSAAGRSGRLWRKGHVAVADETAPPHPRQRRRLVAPRVEHLAGARSPRHERGGVSGGSRARTDMVEVQDGAWERLPRRRRKLRFRCLRRRGVGGRGVGGGGDVVAVCAVVRAGRTALVASGIGEAAIAGERHGNALPCRWLLCAAG